MRAKTCPICGAPLDPDRRADAAFCSGRCRVAHHRKLKREERDRAKAAALGVSLKRYREVMRGD